MAGIDMNMYETVDRDNDADPHTYMSVGTAEPSTNVARGNQKDAACLKISCRMACLSFFGGILFCIGTSTATGIIVYRLIVDSVLPTSSEQTITTGTNVSFQMDRRLDTLHNDIQALWEIQRSNNNAVQNLNGTMQSLQEKQSRPVAFTVHTPTGTLVDVDKYGDGTPTFSRTVLNIGNAYNTTNGRFTCPIQGTYLFAITVMTNGGGGFLFCQIYQNRNNIATAHSTHSDTTSYDSASVTLFLHLSVGDVVKLNCGKWENVFKNYHTAYSGGFVRAD